MDIRFYSAISSNQLSIPFPFHCQAIANSKEMCTIHGEREMSSALQIDMENGTKLNLIRWKNWRRGFTYLYFGSFELPSRMHKDLIVVSF